MLIVEQQKCVLCVKTVNEMFSKLVLKENGSLVSLWW